MNEKTSEEEFIDWFHARGEYYATLPVKHYMDGEPYFSAGGAECTFRDYMRVKSEFPKTFQNA